MRMVLGDVLGFEDNGRYVGVFMVEVLVEAVVEDLLGLDDVEGPVDGVAVDIVTGTVVGLLSLGDTGCEVGDFEYIVTEYDLLGTIVELSAWVEVGDLLGFVERLSVGVAVGDLITSHLSNSLNDHLMILPLLINGQVVNAHTSSATLWKILSTLPLSISWLTNDMTVVFIVVFSICSAQGLLHFSPSRTCKFIAAPAGVPILENSMMSNVSTCIRL